MNLIRLYTGKDNHSHFEDLGEIDVFCSEKDGSAFLSKEFKVKEFRYAKHPKNYFFDFHIAPRKEYVIILDGAFEIIVKDGSKRIFKKGDILLVEDLLGSGHLA
jgi:quercetin dioxygenase-like cupin family protein